MLSVAREEDLYLREYLEKHVCTIIAVTESTMHGLCTVQRVPPSASAEYEAFLSRLALPLTLGQFSHTQRELQKYPAWYVSLQIVCHSLLILIPNSGL